MYLCWQNDNTVLGVATTEEDAQNMCTEYGDSYMYLEENVAQRRNVDSTPLCYYRTNSGFETWKELVEKGLVKANEN